jgi:hypothetical protein
MVQTYKSFYNSQLFLKYLFYPKSQHNSKTPTNTWFYVFGGKPKKALKSRKYPMIARA